MSLKPRRFGIDKNLYVCNQCGCIYDVRQATLDKGNEYFCSIKCVLLYDKENGNGLLRDR